MSKRKFDNSLLIVIFYFRLIAKILHIGFFAVSISFLFITTVVVSAGWGKTCATFKNMTTTDPSADFDFQCTGKLHAYILEVNGAEFIAAAVRH